MDVGSEVEDAGEEPGERRTAEQVWQQRVFDASYLGRADHVARLLAAEAFPLPDGYALAYAAWKGHVAVVDLLLADPRVDPAANDNMAVCRSAACGHDEILARLLADPRVDPAALDPVTLAALRAVVAGGAAARS